MSVRILGIESSCDETAAAVVRGGRDILSSVVASQDDVHRKYGGVVPELASREHLRRIVPVVREALERARLDFGGIEAIGVTRGPGLIGSLLVGYTYGQTLAAALGKPLVPVNHLEGHVHAVFLEAQQGRESAGGGAAGGAGAAAGRALPELPAVCLIVSGGHTVLYEVRAANGHVAAPAPAEYPAFRCTYARIGATRDDAAGEAYDKVAKLLALGYPGGPVMDQLAAHGNPEAVSFTPPHTRGNPFDFSFSGIKTAVLRHVQQHPAFKGGIAVRQEALRGGARRAADLLSMCTRATLDLVASFQRAVVSDLVHRTIAAAEERAARCVLVSGGVAANSELRGTFAREASARALPVFFPSRALSTDNAAMIAAAAYPRLLAGEIASNGIGAEANLPLA
ncbi:MAG TPA: tRNA (adenosine(37)-N6)-threonylcarbamoyltransferase complex transferase subunit TsaD [Candidatus Acidoferrales bacterium]|nr:tRNA (adenosine(37)-N6)-threonylcarbamoyltransferase complex transferase subunit TsaD [Candidatus Acidoferrales bacterium]